MRTSLVLFIVLFQEEGRARQFFERITFARVDPEGEEARRIVELLRDEKHWMGAYRAIEAKFGLFPDDLRVEVDFNLEVDEYAMGAGFGSKGRVRFNLKKLNEYQKQIGEIERQKKDLARRGRKLTFRVPPARLDRMIYHELTHVFQRGVEAPVWFNEGMAQLMTEDLNCMTAFAVAGKLVESIETPLAETNDTYARGHLFWKWLAARGADRKVVQSTVFERRPWKEALKNATGLAWDSIVAVEREWSAKEIGKLKPK